MTKNKWKIIYEYILHKRKYVNGPQKCKNKSLISLVFIEILIKPTLRYLYITTRKAKITIFNV